MYDRMTSLGSTHEQMVREGESIKRSKIAAIKKELG